MKRIISLVIIAALCLGAFAVSAFAADSATVYVTISDDKGEICVASEEVEVTDADADGTLTISDALYAAHELFYDGGAEEGFAAEDSQYGLSLAKLWGIENGGSYGYYVNNASAMSLGDEIKDDDHINAFVYTDLTAWSDTYCYFDKYLVAADAGEDIELTLSAASFDENWSPITVAVKNACITVDGEKTEVFTDEDGKAVISIEDGGEHIVSAVSDEMTLVPPVLIAAIPEEVTAITSGDEDGAEDESEDEPEEEVETEAAVTATPSSATPQNAVVTTNNNVVKTGYNYAYLLIIAAAAVIAIGVFVSIKKKEYEK